MMICLNSAEYAHAQWTKKDSVWLQNVLSGKEKLQLNPETMKAIQSGSLLNAEPASEMKMAPVNTLPIFKDFSEYINPDDTATHRKIALKDLPVGVFKRYGPPPSKTLPVYQSILDELKRNPPVGPSATGFFDLGKMTSRKEYVHKRNAKRDATWREYNNLPTPDIIKKKKVFENTNPQVAFSVKDTLQLLIKDSLILADTLLKTDSTKMLIPLRKD